VTAKAVSVSVVIPTYNRSAFIVKAIDSVLAQTYADYELIVVDDGSTDSTDQVLQHFGNRITYIRQNNAGVGAARNNGISAASGKWLAFLDSDDEWDSNYLAEQMNHARSIAGLCMQSANCRVCDLNGDSESYFHVNGAINALRGRPYLLIEQPFSFVVTQQPWQVGSMIFLRDAVARAGLFDTELTISEDLDFIARVSLQGRFGLINKELVRIYRRPESTMCLTGLAVQDPIGIRETAERIYEKLRTAGNLSFGQRHALNKLVAANRRGMGNLLWDSGDVKAARKCFRRAFSVYPSMRSLAKMVISCVPRNSSGALRSTTRSAE